MCLSESKSISLGTLDTKEYKYIGKGAILKVSKGAIVVKKVVNEQLIYISCKVLLLQLMQLLLLLCLTIILLDVGI